MYIQQEMEQQAWEAEHESRAQERCIQETGQRCPEQPFIGSFDFYFYIVFFAFIIVVYSIPRRKSK